MARRRPGIEDVLTDEPRVLFVGINPGNRSGALGHHFAGKGNPFWRLLHASGLTPVLLPPEEDRRLAEFGLALTNLCPRTTRTAAELTRDELQRGARALKRKVERLRPRVVALVGVTLYPLVFGEKGDGPGAKAVRLADARVFVVPNPSGLNASFPGFESKLVWFRALKEFVDEHA
jgi:TDG/mug DNA glycosylase family protein